MYTNMPIYTYIYIEVAKNDLAVNMLIAFYFSVRVC